MKGFQEPIQVVSFAISSTEKTLLFVGLFNALLLFHLGAK